MNFKEFSNLLVEINERTILYHRSRSSENLSPGFILGDRERENVILARADELDLEEYRRSHYPEKPSRLRAVFCTVVPRSRFIDRGRLYEVTPIGKTHVTDSRIIDQLFDIWESLGHLRYSNPRFENLLEKYWNPPREIFTRENRKHLEVLAESAKVISPVREKTHDLKKGDRFILTQDLTVDYPKLWSKSELESTQKVLGIDLLIEFHPENPKVLTLKKGFVGIITDVVMSSFISDKPWSKYLAIGFTSSKLRGRLAPIELINNVTGKIFRGDPVRSGILKVIK